MAARFYFLVSFVDSFSRYIVHHKLPISLDGRSVAIELQTALEAVRGARPRIVRDHGSDFVNRDVAAAIETHNSNGIVERFNGTVRAESDDDYGKKYVQADAIIIRLMHHTTRSGYTRLRVERRGIVDSRMKFETSAQGE